MLYALLSLLVLLIALPFVYLIALLFWTMMLWIGNKMLEVYVKVKCKFIRGGN